MRQILSIVLLAAAAVLLVYGVQASDSLASSFSRFFSGTPSDRSIAFLVAGVLCAVIGLSGLLRAPRPAR